MSMDKAAWLQQQHHPDIRCMDALKDLHAKPDQGCTSGENLPWKSMHLETDRFISVVAVIVYRLLSHNIMQKSC